MLPIQSVLYEMLPRRNVTIRKCTIRNVTDPYNSSCHKIYLGPLNEIYNKNSIKYCLASCQSFEDVAVTRYHGLPDYREQHYSGHLYIQSQGDHA